VPAKLSEKDGQSRFVPGSIGKYDGIAIATVHHIEPVIDNVLSGENGDMPDVTQGFDVLGRKSDFLESFGVKRIPDGNIPNGCEKFLKLQFPERIFRVKFGPQQFPVAPENVFSIQEIVNGRE